MIDKSVKKAKAATEKRMSVFMGNIGGILGMAQSQGTEVIKAEVK